MVTYEKQSSKERTPVTESVQNTTELENSEAEVPVEPEPEPNFVDPYTEYHASSVLKIIVNLLLTKTLQIYHYEEIPCSRMKLGIIIILIFLRQVSFAFKLQVNQIHHQEKNLCLQM